MADRILTLRELNRATLARQLLLDRAPLPVPQAIERLVGLQAQVPNPPYIGLWTRLRDFRRDALTGLMKERQVVRATLMRSTLHLMTAGDYLLLRGALQPALTRALVQQASSFPVVSVAVFPATAPRKPPGHFGLAVLGCFVKLAP